jgi:hypothetical protein
MTWTYTLAYYDTELIMGEISFIVQAVGLEVTNALAYFDTESIAAVKCFIV